MEQYNESYWHQPDPGRSWNEQTTMLEQAELELCRIEGVEKLEALDYESQTRTQTDISGYVDGAYPDKVFDAIEVFTRQLGRETQSSRHEWASTNVWLPDAV